MRFVGKSRLRFFPLPLSEGQRIRRFLLFPDQPSSAVEVLMASAVAWLADFGCSAAEIMFPAVTISVSANRECAMLALMTCNWFVPHPLMLCPFRLFFLTLFLGVQL